MWKKKALALLIVCTLILSMTSPVYAVDPTVQVWLPSVNSTDTGMEKVLSQEASLTFDTDDGTKISNLIIVDESKQYQSMDGFGASITEASAHLYQDVLASDQKDDVMNAIFDKETGIGVSMLRQPIGATDHCVAPYNFAPNSQDDSLPNFDFSHELEEIFLPCKMRLLLNPAE